MPYDSDYDPKSPILAAVRKELTRLPEATEIETWGHPTFRVRNKMFGGFGTSDRGATLTLKQAKVDQAILLADDRFFMPKYVGKHGWVGLYAEELPWDQVAELLEDGYRLTAPKKLIAKLDD